MVTQKPDIRLLHLLYTDARFESILTVLDALHDAASEGRSHEVSALPKDELIGWLQDIAYTARETIRELETDRPIDGDAGCPPASEHEKHGERL